VAWWISYCEAAAAPGLRNQLWRLDPYRADGRRGRWRRTQRLGEDVDDLPQIRRGDGSIHEAKEHREYAEREQETAGKCKRKSYGEHDDVLLLRVVQATPYTLHLEVY
jgi:hypothetical protein